MAATDFTVAIELGSTEITGIAGKKNADGSIELLAYASERSSACIKKGAIYNLDKTAQCLNSIIQQLEDKLKASIKKVYVGMGGQSIHSILNTITRKLDQDIKISQHLIDAMLQSNKEITLIDKELLAVEPQEYKIGNNLLTEPVGIQADNIEGRFLNIIARDTLKSNINQCFKQTTCDIADYFMAPIVTANAVLTTNEKRSGCALIDFGADTTTVSVYKNNLLRHVAVIPLGSSNITKDICSLQLEEDEAELLKLRYASAYTDLSEDQDEEETTKEYKVENKGTISAHTLADIVEARVNEILTNVRNQILLSNYDEKLLAGIVVTGGACNLPNLDKAIKRILQIDKIRIAKASEVSLSGDIELPANGTCNTLIGILAAGKENCCRINPMKTAELPFAEELVNTIPTRSVTEEGTNNLVSQQNPVEQQRLEQEEQQRNLEEQQKELQRQQDLKQLELQTKQDQETKERERIELEEKKRVECQNLVRDASQLILDRKYPEGLELLKKARLLEVAAKQAEIDALEKEASRLLEEAKRVEQLKAIEFEKEKIRAKERAEKSRDLIEEARQESARKHHKNALSLLEEAARLNVAENKEEIENLRNEIGKKNKNWILTFFEKVSNASDNLMKDDE